MKRNPIFIVYIKKVEKYKPTQILIGKDIQKKIKIYFPQIFFMREVKLWSENLLTLYKNSYEITRIFITKLHPD